jgi:hypothetical protein
MPRFTGFLLLGMLSTFLLGCSPQAATDTLSNGNPSAVLLAGQLPPLPDAREASVLLDFTQLGHETFSRNLNAWDEGSSLRMPSSTNSIIWGVWGFGSATNATSCRVDFNGESGAQAYFAISDFEKGAWEISGPFAGPQHSIAIDDPRYTNGSGDLYIAVIAYGGANILVDQLVLSADISPVQTTIDNSGGYTSLALVNGHPAISYYDDGDHNLRYVRASDPFGSAWGTPLTLDSTGDTGQYTSLKVVDGNPAIAYYDFTNKDLRYIRALDASGATWGTPMTVDGLPAVGEYCSLDVVAGNPAISYFDYDGPELRYVRALDTTGVAWGTPVGVDNDGNTGQYTSLEVVAGVPAIAYRNGGAGQLRYVHASDAEGTTWATPLILDATSNTGFHTSLVVVNGDPAIAYYDGSAGELRYIRASDAPGDAWGPSQILDGVDDDAGAFCSMAVIGGVPAISYYNGLHGDLRYIQAGDANGSSWGSAVLLDESSNVTGRDTSLIELYGTAAVSYYDQTNAKLRYMWGF